MKFSETPDHEDDEEYEAFLEDKYILGYKSWDVLECVDVLLEDFGLELEVFENRSDPLFRIVEKE